MKISYSITKTDKQKEAIKLIANNETVLLEGGSRSGKTFIILYAILIRALSVPGSCHLITRFRFSHAKASICYQTMPTLLRKIGLDSSLNKSEWFYEFPNGSTIWVGGLDDKERTEKMLGNEYSTIFLNEASQISFDAYELILTRLNPSPGLRAKMLIDYNPPSTKHWGYTMFHKRQFPDGRPVPDSNFATLKMNPVDNPHLDVNYLERLSLLSEIKRRRFLDGEYSLDSGSMFKREWIKYNKETPESMTRIVIGVDPAGSVGGDEIGIIVVGECYGEFWVLDDYSLHGTPKEWADEVAAAYDKWQADVVVAERNYGGDMVKSTIDNAKPGINVKMVTSSRGKALRAEPISALYEQGKVIHRIMFNDLEDEMCLFEPGQAHSPNRLDAMVFAITELSGEGLSMLDVI